MHDTPDCCALGRPGHSAPAPWIVTVWTGSSARNFGRGTPCSWAAQGETGLRTPEYVLALGRIRCIRKGCTLLCPAHRIDRMGGNSYAIAGRVPLDAVLSHITALECYGCDLPRRAAAPGLGRCLGLRGGTPEYPGRLFPPTVHPFLPRTERRRIAAVTVTSISPTWIRLTALQHTTPKQWASICPRTLMTTPYGSCSRQAPRNCLGWSMSG